MRQTLVRWVFAQLQPHIVALVAELLTEAEQRLAAAAAQRDAQRETRPARRFIGQ
jgi:hypothetical protein